ncbi:hypothetical protein G6F32_015120 [Rhizopus arrhizus]|nr:hypothetical protein G6F32_015120 [Rhizopus arrhizus]
MASMWRRCAPPIAGSTSRGRSTSASGRIRGVGNGHRGQPRLCAVGPLARPARPAGPRRRHAGPGAGLDARKSHRGGHPPARGAFDVQPSAKPHGTDRREGGVAARMRVGRRFQGSRATGAADQGAAVGACECAPH